MGKVVQKAGKPVPLPATAERCRSSFTPLQEGLTLVRSHYYPQQAQVEESSQPASCPQLVLTFGLSGNSCYREHGGQQIHFRHQHLTITSFHGSSGERHYRAGERLQQIRLVLSADAVAHYFGEQSHQQLFRRQRLTCHADRRFSPASAHHLAQLAAQRESPLMQQIQALNLLALQRPLLQPDAEKSAHPQDVQRLEQAREWMTSHLAQPFSLTTLAMAVGLSDYKLKQGFHLHYHTTPGQMLLQQAHLLLEQGYQVAQAGWQVGYRHANNFSVAFYRYYGYHASTVSIYRKK